MQPYQQRAVEEHKGLVERRQHLASAINDRNDFKHFSNAEQARMKRQLNVMVQYEDVLGERLQHFTR